MTRTLTAVLAVLLWALPAHAASITFGGSSVDDHGQFTTVAGATTVDFDAIPLGNQSFTSGIATYQANIFNCGCPGDGDVRDDTTRGARALVGTALTIDFSQPIRYFGLNWGSPDRGNLLTVFDGVTTVATVDGNTANIGAGGFGITHAVYVNVTADPGESFTRVVLSSVDFPFETDNHAYVAASSVPEPASLTLIGSGVAAAIARIRRRRRPLRA